jgi:hypothetical protein
VTQAHNIWVMENAFIHVAKSEKSAINIDQTVLSTWMTEFSTTLMLWACVTLGFFTSVYKTTHDDVLTNAKVFIDVICVFNIFLK